jgi:hypothetical protein
MCNIALNMDMQNSKEWLGSCGITGATIHFESPKPIWCEPNAPNSIEQTGNGIYQVGS